MKPLYRLRAIRLLNWHNFVDETILVDGSLFLIGDNGSGKTTLLDAVHCALTGDWKVELNAAARIAGRRGEGRDLAGIVLRHDVERGYQREGGAVAYAALELARAEGPGRAPERLSIGIGLFVASPEARPEKWGFVLPRPLAEVPLVVDASTPGARRPADRRELAAALGAGAVLDVGRYRTAVGERLFGSREHLEEVASFLQAGKAYRELVTRTQNFSDLFAGLLREPEIETYDEARRALDAIERLRADREALGVELEALRRLIDWRGRVAAERGNVARYDFLGAHHAAALAQAELERIERDAGAAEAGLADARRAHAAALGRIEALETERERLRGTSGAELLERRRELEAQARERSARAAELERDRDRRREALREGEQALAGLARELGSAAAGGRAALARISSAAGAEPGGGEAPQAGESLASLEQRLAALERSPASESFDARLASGERRAAARILQARARELREESARREREAQLARTTEEQAGNELDALRARGTPEPPLAGLDAARELLQGAQLSAAPLFELLEPRRGVSPDELGLVERALGPRLLGALVVPAEQHARARELLLEHAPGVPLVDSSPDATPSPGPAAGSLAEERVLDLLRIDGAHPAAAALLERHAGGLAWLGEARDAGGEFLLATGRLRAARLDERLHGGPARWIGARARRAAFEKEVEELEGRAREARSRALEASAQARELGERASRIDRALELLEELELDELGRLVLERDHCAGRAVEAREALAATEAAWAAQRAQVEELGRTLEALARSLAEQGLDALAERLAELERELRGTREELSAADRAIGDAEARLRAAQGGLEAARGALEEAGALRARARARLLPVVPEEARADLEDWVLRTKRGAQMRPENVAPSREAALRAEERFAAQIEGSDGVRHHGLWQKYAFRYDRDANALADSAGRDVDEDATRLQEELDQVDLALGEKSRDLLERVVLEELAGALRRDVHELETTIRGVNAQIEDLEFGRNRYRIDARLRPEFRRLLRLLEQSSALSPAAREELKDFFSARLDDFSSAGGDELPAFLDYRQWYEFSVKVSTAGSDGVELTRGRRAQGSGGEQAVPSYLLLFCLTTLLYEGIGARARLLLLDEAFYGIDLGRRDELLRFCERAGIDLVVATPEMDGVTDALAASTTLLVEKTATSDVYLWDARYRSRPESLFDPATPPEKLVIGLDPDAPRDA